MTQPQDPRKQPLQDDEIALARVLRALPAGEPSPQIDAAILAAATDAVAAGHGGRPRARKPNRALPWLPSWAIGTAAAAVLAVGIGVQLRPPLAPTVSPQAEQADAFRPLPESRPRMDVELPQAPQALPPPPAPPPAQPAQVRRQSQAPLPPPPPPAPAPVAAPPASAPVAAVADAFPEPAPEATAAESAESESLDSITVTGTRLPAPAAEAGDQARRRHQSAYATRAQQRAAAERELQELRAQARSDNEYSRGDAGAAAKASPSEAFSLPPVAEDARLPLGEWFDRIRVRRALGETEDARESLALLRRDHPDVDLPDDLADLR